ncbi:hypothetical protein BKA93DRAFT_732835 [Sparassis latifolia]|uniref:Uncharacterized protein n=1 Tax=Sparassis crispa TaxID=139825 RepID=A0A401GWA3_9APHY|nr:predicted protein [Sparassis crispa]GBE86507.1 predicted protein [Sparassis crispa]
MSDYKDSVEDLSHDFTRPHSIDLTLELEHQLEAESLPNSPSVGRPRSLDTHVLASLITQLRMSVEELTKERDGLSNLLVETKSREQDTQEALTIVAEKCVHLEAELAAAQNKIQEDEDAITMLRGKVEESRRGLMRLQTESRRMSQMSNLTLDLSRAGQPMLSGPPTSKRASFTPLTGSSAGRTGHRRISSVSDTSLIMSAPHFGDHGQWPASPRSPVEFSQPALTAPAHGRRASGFFGFGTGAVPEPARLVDASEVEVLRKELETVKDQLEETRHELGEAQEAKEASEMCVRALRTFIAENSVGEQTTRSSVAAKPPPMSANSSQDSAGRKSVSSASRWGFKLWNTSDTAPPSAPSPPSGSASPAMTQGGPLSKKLGGMFSPRASVSSTSSAPRPRPMQQEPSFIGSDTSSIADSSPEPVSPASEMPRTSVLVQDGEVLLYEAHDEVKAIAMVASG